MKIFKKILFWMFLVVFIFLVALFCKIFLDVEILYPPSQIGCSEDYQCKYSEGHNSCGNVDYKNIKGNTVYTKNTPACQCSFFMCMEE